jgi:hypothetical protein
MLLRGVRTAPWSFMFTRHVFGLRGPWKQLDDGGKMSKVACCGWTMVWKCDGDKRGMEIILASSMLVNFGRMCFAWAIFRLSLVSSGGKGVYLVT